METRIVHRLGVCASILLLATGGMGAGEASRQRGAGAEVERKIDSLLSIMTPEEKTAQLTQYSVKWDEPKGRTALIPEQEELVKKGCVGSFLNLYGSAATRQIQKIAVEKSRLKIPLLFGYDVIHGFRTTFPIPLAEASTWEPALIQKAARVAANEASASGIHWTFAPMVDIARDPRWGRIAEGSGEDPYLGAAMAAARVRGFQGDDLSRDSTILACPKHFAAYGGAEGGRDYNTVDISERTLREVYLPPFEAAVKAGAATIMCSFNEIAGVPSTANGGLLRGILRNEWGFDGFVVSDWGSIGELRAHGIAGSLEEAARIAIHSGIDMDMESNAYRLHLGPLVSSGRVPVRELDEAVRRVLRAKFRLGLFEDPFRYCNPEREHTVTLTPANRALAREVARRSMVLLKNEKDLLPLKKEAGTIAVLGPLADDARDPLGPWDALGDPAQVVTVLEGIRRIVSPGTTVLYAPGCPVDTMSTAGIAEAVAIARRADLVVLVVGEGSWMSGEAASRSDLGLPGSQEDLAKAIHATGRPVVAVLMNGRPLAIPWMAANIPALLEAWFPGVEAGHAVADLLFGDASPSAKLPVTFPRSVGQVPFYYNAKPTGRPADDTAKYTSRYIDLPSSPLYPFGHGLSFTSFRYEKLSLSSPIMGPEGTLTVTVDVTNVGKRPGEEVVQLYLRDDVASLTRPLKELKGFEKVSLRPGEKKSVSFTITTENLAMYDITMKRRIEPGTFTVFVGGNSRDLLSARFEYRSGGKGM